MHYFGPYVVYDEIARGGQGAVYTAEHTQLRTPAALKILLEPDHLGIKRFRQEAKVLAKLDHTNILKALDLGSHNGFPYLAMEFVSGSDLKRLLAEGYPTKKALKALSKIAKALHYCHNRGIIHRDLKPANILIEAETERPVLIDFGLIKRDKNMMSMGSIDRSRLSLTGEIKGTPAYMAPEQLDGVETPLTDVYGLGGILYRILTGHTPFEVARGGQYQLMIKIMQEDPPHPHTHNRNIPDSLATLCMMSLSKDPADRPASAKMFADLLEEATRKPNRKAQKKRSLLPGLLAGGVLAGGLGGGFALYDSYSQDAQIPPTPTPSRASVIPSRTPSPTPVEDWTTKTNQAVNLANDSKRAFKRRDFDEALALINRALETIPSRAPDDMRGQLFSQRADIYHASGNFERAEQDYTAAIRLDPDAFWSYFGRGRLYATSNRTVGTPARAASDYTRCLEINPNFRQAEAMRGDIRTYMAEALDGSR